MSNRTKNRDIQPKATVGELGILALVGTAVFALIYLMLFYLSQPWRAAYWQLMLVPDVVWHYWTAGEQTFTLLDRLPHFALTAWWLVVAYCSGAMLLRLLSRVVQPVDQEQSALEWFVLSTTVGLAAQSTALLFTGFWGWNRAIAWTVCVVVVLMELVPLLRRIKQFPSLEMKSGDWTMVAAWTVLTLPYLFSGPLPPWEFDVREYHLQVPKEWFQAGRIHFLPHNVYGNMPLGAELHAVGAMLLWFGDDAWWHGALVGKTIIGLHAPLTALALWSAGQRWRQPLAGWLAGVLYLTFPWIAHVSFHGLIDAVLAHYAWMSIYLVLASRPSYFALIVQGWLLGATASIKYTALPLVVLPLSFYLAWERYVVTRKDGGRTLSSAMILFVVAAFAAGGGWYAKNWSMTNNPVYPLAGNLFAEKIRTEERIAQWNQAHAVPRDENGNRYSVRAAWRSLRCVLLDSPWLNSCLWPLVIIGCMSRWRQTSRQVWGLFLFMLAWMFVVWWLASHRLDRFWLPAVPLACWWASWAWWGNDSRLWRATISIIVALGLVHALLMIASPVTASDGSLHALGDQRWLVPLAKLQQEGTAAHQWLNEHCEPEDVVLLVGDAQPFDLRVRVIYNTCFDPCGWEKRVRDKSMSDVLDTFQTERIRYILVDWRELERYRSPGNYGYSDFVQPEQFRELTKAGVLELVFASPSENGEDQQIFWVKPRN